MTDKQIEETQKLQDTIMNLCYEKHEMIVINALMSSLINVTYQLNIPPDRIVEGLIIGFTLATEMYADKIGEKETIN